MRRIREIAAGIDVLEPVALLRQPLRGHGQHIQPVQREPVRALPHVSKRLVRGQRVRMRPMEAVFGGKHKHLALVRKRARALHHIIGFPFLPDLGVADMAGQPGRIVGVFHQKPFAVRGQTVARDREAGIVAAARRDIVVVALMLDVAGVIEVHDAVLDEGRAGIHAVEVIGLVGE